MLALAPFASGAPSVINPAVTVEFVAAPALCAGGVSSVRPLTVTKQGAGPPQVAGSLTETFNVSIDVRNRRSAIPDGGGNVVKLITRNRNRVIGPPVLFTTRFRIVSVPKVELFPGSAVKSRTRFGADEDKTD